MSLRELKENANQTVYRVKSQNWQTFASAILEKIGVREDVRCPVVDGLCETSLRGVDSHGIRLFPHYVLGVQKGRINPSPEYQFQRLLPACGQLDADHTFGHAAGTEAIRHAITMAEEVGIGAVAVHNSTHFGAAACFALQAARRGYISFAFSHADALLLSHDGIRPFFGTNPICFAAPAAGEDPFCLDMGLGIFNWNKILTCREQSIPLDAGIAAGVDGEQVRDAQLAKSLYPIGSYKGFGLGAMVEVLCSLLSGMAFGRSIPPMYTTPMDQKRSLGHFFLVMRPDGFLDPHEFSTRMQELMRDLRQEPGQLDRQVKVPGDPEKEQFSIRSREGIPVDAISFDKFMTLAKEFGVTLPVQ